MSLTKHIISEAKKTILMFGNTNTRCKVLVKHLEGISIY